MSTASVLDYSSSDHLPIFLQVRLFLPRSTPRLFRFENSWSLELGCREIVHSVWSDPTLGSVLDKLKVCSSRLGDWGSTMRQQFQLDIDNCKKVLGLLRGKRDNASRREFNTVKARFVDLLQRREWYWR